MEIAHMWITMQVCTAELTRRNVILKAEAKFIQKNYLVIYDNSLNNKLAVAEVTFSYYVNNL